MAKYRRVRRFRAKSRRSRYKYSRRRRGVRRARMGRRKNYGRRRRGGRRGNMFTKNPLKAKFTKTFYANTNPKLTAASATRIDQFHIGPKSAGANPTVQTDVNGNRFQVWPMLNFSLDRFEIPAPPTDQSILPDLLQPQGTGSDQPTGWAPLNSLTIMPNNAMLLGRGQGMKWFMSLYRYFRINRCRIKIRPLTKSYRSAPQFITTSSGTLQEPTHVATTASTISTPAQAIQLQFISSGNTEGKITSTSAAAILQDQPIYNHVDHTYINPGPHFTGSGVSAGEIFEQSDGTGTVIVPLNSSSSVYSTAIATSMPAIGTTTNSALAASTSSSTGTITFPTVNQAIEFRTFKAPNLQVPFLVVSYDNNSQELGNRIADGPTGWLNRPRIRRFKIGQGGRISFRPTVSQSVSMDPSGEPDGQLNQNIWYKRKLPRGYQNCFQWGAGSVDNASEFNYAFAMWAMYRGNNLTYNEEDNFDQQYWEISVSMSVTFAGRSTTFNPQGLGYHVGPIPPEEEEKKMVDDFVDNFDKDAITAEFSDDKFDEPDTPDNSDDEDDFTGIHK